MNWHPFCVKFPQPEGAEWEAFKASIKATRGNDAAPVLFRMVDGKPEGLDGRTRYLACKELRIKPKMKKVSVKDEDVKAFIIRHNITRRHITPELRAALVADLRDDGQSTRQIAETLGTSHATVQRDLESGGTNVPPEGSAKVTGKDGKKYRATVNTTTDFGDANEGPVLCDRCQRVGAAKDCPKCEKARAGAARAASRKGARAGAQKNGQQAYDTRPFNDHFGGLMRQIDVLGKLYGSKEAPAAEKLRDQLGVFKTAFLNWQRELTAARKAG